MAKQQPSENQDLPLENILCAETARPLEQIHKLLSRPAARLRPRHYKKINTNKSKCQVDQSFKDECDINNIMAQHKRTGVIDHVNSTEPQYGNFLEAQDYHTSLNMLRQADEAFMEIPAHIRQIFNNDPGQFIEFAENPENIKELRKMGLAPPAAAPDADPSVKTTPPPQKGEPAPPAAGDPPAGGEPPQAPPAT